MQHKNVQKHNIMFQIFLSVSLLSLVILFPANVQATSQDVTVPQETTISQDALKEADTLDVELKFRKQTINPNSIPSILFTKWEYGAINEAIESIGQLIAVRAPSEEEIEESEKVVVPRYEPKVRPPPQERDISLSGIVYRDKKDWTFWLNGKRVTPDALPKEIVDIRVYKEYIEMKWYDDYSQNIYPIKLRPHQRFNLDTRIFLPG